MKFSIVLVVFLCFCMMSITVSANYTNLAVGKSYTYNFAPNGGYPDTGMLEMTDGILPTFGSGSCWSDGKTAMWQTSPSIYLNLGGEHEIQNVTLYSCRGANVGDAGVYEPLFVEFYGSDDNSTWVLLANVTSSSSGKFEADNIYKTKKYLKIYSRAQGDWLPIGEVQIFAGDPINLPAVTNPINLVSNTTYSYNVAPNYGGYPDTNMQEMTNGILPTYGSSACWSDGNSAIWSSNPIVYMHIIPVSNLKNMTVYTCRGSSNGEAGIAIPSAVDFYGSYDNSTWFDMGRSSVESAGKFSINASNNNYTYFKITTYNGGGGMALGEIKIFGDELTTTTTTTSTTTTTISPPVGDGQGSATQWSQVFWYVAETIAHSIHYGIYNSSISCDQTHLFYVNGVTGMDYKINTSTDKYGVYHCQNSTQGVIVISNDGSVNIGINSSFSNVPTGIKMKFGHASDAWKSACGGYCNVTACDLSSDCLLVNVTPVRIAYLIPQNGSKEYWMWADFNKVAGTVNPIKGNMTTIASMTR